MEKLKNAKWKILALLLVGGLGLLAAYFEPALEKGKSCLDAILGSPKFMVFFAGVLIVCFATALHKKTNTKFFIWLLVSGFFIGLITQMIGTTNNLWTYKQSFVFGGFSWALAAATMLGLYFLIKKLLKKLFREIGRKAFNIIGLIILVLIIIIFLNEFRTTVRLNFWIYYFALFVFAAVITYHLRIATFLSLILAAWIMGFVSEYMGASIGLWQFFAEPAQSEAAGSVTCRFPPPFIWYWAAGRWNS